MDRKRKLDLEGGAGGNGSTSDAYSASSSPSLNPLTGRSYSDRYRTLREQRMKLPVFQFLDQLETYVKSNQVVIVEGETGSGKTTQVRGGAGD